MWESDLADDDFCIQWTDKGTHFFCWDLHSEIPAGHHDAVRLAENLVIVDQTLCVLDLGDDLDASATGIVKNPADELDIGSALQQAGYRKKMLISPMMFVPLAIGGGKQATANYNVGIGDLEQIQYNSVDETHITTHIMLQLKINYPHYYSQELRAVSFPLTCTKDAAT